MYTSEKALFLKHMPCPNCLSKDNLGLYSDGHMWCFGCGFLVPATRSLSAPTTIRKEARDGTIDWEYLRSVPIPSAPLGWLRSYEITNEEIQAQSIVWDPKTSLLIMPFFDDERVCVCYSGRYFGPYFEHPKYLTFGERALTYPFYGKDPTTLVVVEDYISAVKVGRSFAGWAMLGANVNLEALNSIAGAFKRVAVWLDADKASVASKAVLRASLSLHIPVVRVTTAKDPKDYRSNYRSSEIKEIIELSFKL